MPIQRVAPVEDKAWFSHQLRELLLRKVGKLFPFRGQNCNLRPFKCRNCLVAQDNLFCKQWGAFPFTIHGFCTSVPNLGFYYIHQETMILGGRDVPLEVFEEIGCVVFSV